MMPSERGSHDDRSGPPASAPLMRLRSGARLTVVGERSDGWAVESAARLLPGSSVEVVLASGGRGSAWRALVTRSEVIAIDRRHGVRYRAVLRLRDAPEGTSGMSDVLHGNEVLMARGHKVPVTAK